MKKLMFMLAMAVAVAAQAGTVTWGAELFTAGEGGAFTTTEVADGSVNGSLWMLTQAAFDSYYGIYESQGYAKMSEAIYKDYTDGTLGTASKTGTSVDGMLNLSDGVKYASKADVYAAVLYTMTQDGNDYYIANIGDFTATSANKTVYDMASYEIGGGTSGTSTAITGWTGAAVPEPTSGLLLLVGGALLALRRKRA